MYVFHMLDLPLLRLQHFSTLWTRRRVNGLLATVRHLLLHHIGLRWVTHIVLVHPTWLVLWHLLSSELIIGRQWSLWVAWRWLLHHHLRGLLLGLIQLYSSWVTWLLLLHHRSLHASWIHHWLLTNNLSRHHRLTHTHHLRLLLLLHHHGLLPRLHLCHLLRIPSWHLHLLSRGCSRLLLDFLHL